MAFKPTNKTHPDSGEIILFTGTNYTGDAYSAVIGDNVDNGSNSLNDKLYSIRLGKAAKVVLTRDYDFSGPTKEITHDIPDIHMGGPGSGLTCFIVIGQIQRVGKFSFKDEESDSRSLTLKSSNFDPDGNGVTIPNPHPKKGKDPYAPRVFTILKDDNTIDHSVTVAIYVRKNDGSYEPIGASISVYLDDNGRLQAKKLAGDNYGNLVWSNKDNLLAFVWKAN